MNDYPFSQYFYNVGVQPDIAPGVYINGIVDCAAKVTIEKDVFFGHGVMLLTGSHDYTKFGIERIKNGKANPITIREGAWIASGVIILAPVEIGKHAVVGAGSVVTKDIPEYELWCGNPAKFIKRIPH
jgi:acetyltransferase-like isoleucine patch superfamily enzyme